jgi:ribonuclease P protein component
VIGKRPATYPRSHRLSGKLQFQRVFDEKVKVTRGPLVVFSRPNDLPHPRLGISIPRSVGMATRRNRIKRLLREAFRLMRHDFPRAYDLVVVVRQHQPLILAEYQKLLMGALVRLHNLWANRDQP